MDHRIADSPTHPLRRAVAAAAVCAVVILLATAAGSGLGAQTLADPNPPPKWTPPVGAKPSPPARVKSCSLYGAGFVNVPGSDACVKIGGFVSTEAGRGR